MKILTQKNIDDGRIGGFISVFSGSLVVLTPFSFIGILALNYDRYIKYWINLNMFIVLSVIAFVAWEWLYFTFVIPSIIRFSNRQSYEHGNPVKDEFEKINEKLDKLLKEKN